MVSAVALVLPPSVALGQPPACSGTSVVFGFTGAATTFDVPPAVTQVTVDAAGAEGGGVPTLRGGFGARLVATFAVTPGETLNVVVGGMGATVFPMLVGGGGGGSFVYRTADAAGLLLAAAGGGGIGSCGTGVGGSATTAAANGQGTGGGTGGTAGTGGNGGGAGSGVACTGAGGGGLLTNGGNSASCPAMGGQALANGANGGAGAGTGGVGGFGGGGGGGQNGLSEGGGGGGGFNGGGGGAKTFACGSGGGIAGGGGGGSFSASAPSFSQSGAQTGNGQVSFCFTPAPSIAKSFTPAAILVGGTSTMSFTLTNSSATQALSNVSFSDTFPAGLAVANPPAVADTCGFTTGIPAAGATSFTVGGGSVAASSSCTFSVTVTATNSGHLQNSASGVSSNEAPTGAGSNTATLAVAGAPAIPTLSELGLLLASLLLAAFGVRRLVA